MLNAVILAAVILAGGILMWPRLSNAPLWRATITPLASIIGSGFLVLGPILDVSYGGYAPLVMLALCATAYLFGAAIRFNIVQRANDDRRTVWENWLEHLASATLAFAYFISVAYYLNLFGAFGVSLTEINDSYHANLVTSAVLVLILVVGWTRGFLALERMEQVSVGLKLSIIVGLLVGLAAHFGEVASRNALEFGPSQVSGWAAMTLLFGLVVTVQGFETSRYLGASYDAATRVRSMKIAQWVSTVIYLVYIFLLAYAFRSDPLSLSETAIIDLMRVVAPVLPVLLVAAALSAQFSAAIADTAGSGGLIHELSRGLIPEKLSYAILVGVGLVLTWTANIFEIISYASRAFAAYYAIQSMIAAIAAMRAGHKLRAVLFALLALLGAIITVFGAPVE